MKALIPIIFLSLIWFSSDVSGQTSKKRQKEIKQYWKKELRTAKSINHTKVARQYPEMGWMSGLWCREGEDEPSRHIQMEGAKNIRIATRGYTAAANKYIHFPKQFEYLPAKENFERVMVGNETHYDLWYAPKGTGAVPTRYVYVERIRKLANNKFEVVYRKNYTVRNPSVRISDFYKEESPKIGFFDHWKKAQVYVKCK